MTFKYTEIMEFVKKGIIKGSYQSKLPSIRGMAIRFSCSNSTVIKAYSELADQGIIYSAPKSGYFINFPSNDGGWVVYLCSGSHSRRFSFSHKPLFLLLYRQHSGKILGIGKIHYILFFRHGFEHTLRNGFLADNKQFYIYKHLIP